MIVRALISQIIWPLGCPITAVQLNIFSLAAVKLMEITFIFQLKLFSQKLPNIEICC